MPPPVFLIVSGPEDHPVFRLPCLTRDIAEAVSEKINAEGNLPAHGRSRVQRLSLVRDAAEVRRWKFWWATVDEHGQVDESSTGEGLSDWQVEPLLFARPPFGGPYGASAWSVSGPEDALEQARAYLKLCQDRAAEEGPK